jgi:uncharacterized RDD family membrane protein YckC
MNVESNAWNSAYSIETPELVGLDVPLAGIGSRCLALLVDYAVQAGLFALGISGLYLMGRALRDRAFEYSSTYTPSPRWIVAILILIPFLLHWAYFALFEAFWNGRTPGKRLMRLRVMHQTGRSLTFLEALTRNLIRTVDAAPVFYAVGLISVFVTSRNQRLGDLAAGTLVIHEAPSEVSLWNGSAARSITAAHFGDVRVAVSHSPASGLPADALGRLLPRDLIAVDKFLNRRLDLPLTVRAELAARLAAQLRARTGLVASTLSDETLIEAVEHEARGVHG